MPALSRTSLKEDSGVRKPGKLDPARIPSAAFSASTKLSLSTYIGSSVLSHCKILKSVQECRSNLALKCLQHLWLSCADLADQRQVAAFSS